MRVDLADAWRHCWTSTSAILKNILALCLVVSILVFLVVLCNSIFRAPLFQLKRLYVPALDKSLNSSTNATIDFTVYFETDGGASNLVYFDPVNVSFYDGPNLNHSIANFTVPQFNLVVEENESVEYSGTANATGLDLDGAKQEIATNGFKVFRMTLITSVRYKNYEFWKTKRYAYRKSVDVKIGDTGAAPKTVNGFVGIRVMITVNLIIAVFLCSYY